MPPIESVTALLNQSAQGQNQALNRLFSQTCVNKELKRMAHWHIRKERDGYMLQPTELIHEVFMRFEPKRDKQWESRGQFFGWMSGLMRNFLVDRARHRNAAKRGYGAAVDSLDSMYEEAAESIPSTDDGLCHVQLRQAFKQLQTLDPQQYKVVELRVSGLSVVQTAEALSISEATVKREYATGCAWIYLEMGVVKK
jgi:RNA polymerase sigma factor (TIGR02999 family)